MDSKKKIPDRLEELKNENPFSVPEGYFNSFQQRLQDRIQSEKVNSNPERSPAVISRLVWAGAVAAVFIVAFVVSKNIIGTGNNQPLSEDEIAYAFEQEIYDLDEAEILENLDEMIQDNDPENGYSDEIILYLLDEDIEIDNIVNEL